MNTKWLTKQAHFSTFSTIIFVKDTSHYTRQGPLGEYTKESILSVLCRRKIKSSTDKLFCFQPMDHENLTNQLWFLFLLWLLGSSTPIFNQHPASLSLQDLVAGILHNNLSFIWFSNPPILISSSNYCSLLTGLQTRWPPLIHSFRKRSHLPSSAPLLRISDVHHHI